MTHILAIDLGTGGPKVALVRHDGEVVGVETEPNTVDYLPGGGAEQDPDMWWRSIVTATRRLLARGLVPVDDVGVVIAASHWASTVAVGSGGHHLHNSLTWLDSRGNAEATRIAGGPIRVSGYDPRKVARWVRYSGGAPSLGGKDPIGHIAWLRRHHPEVYAEAEVFLEPMDYLNLRLTGRACASYDTIATYWVTDNRDLTSVRYRDDLIEMAEIDRAKLPDLVPTGSVIGEVLPAVATELGLAPGVKVVSGLGDTNASAIGSGAVADLDAHLYIGTSSVISCHVPFKKTDPFHLVASLPSGVPGRYFSACTQESGGAALTFLIERMLFPDDGLGIAPPADVHARLNEVAASVPPGANGVLFTPWLTGERTPVDDANVRAGYHNLTATSTRADLVRATFEGVAHNARWMNHYVERFAKTRFDKLTFVGGGALSPLWGQILADVLDREIHRMADPRSAGVRGAALAASVALGLTTWQAAGSAVPVEEIHRPDPPNRRLYDQQHQVFVRLYRNNRSTYAKLAANHRPDHGSRRSRS